MCGVGLYPCVLGSLVLAGVEVAVLCPASRWSCCLQPGLPSEGTEGPWGRDVLPAARIDLCFSSVWDTCPCPAEWGCAALLRGGNPLGALWGGPWCQRDVSWCHWEQGIQVWQLSWSCEPAAATWPCSKAVCFWCGIIDPPLPFPLSCFR